jgi:hypothetical protein
VGRHICPQTVVSESCHFKNPAKHVGLVQSGPHHHLIENELVLAMIYLKQQIPILWFLGWPDRGLNSRSIALEVSTLTITPPMWFNHLIVQRLNTMYKLVPKFRSKWFRKSTLYWMDMTYWLDIYKIRTPNCYDHKTWCIERRV